MPMHAPDFSNRTPLPVPYLADIPAVLSLQPGRQLFVDDYLIDPQHTTMTRAWHQPVKHTGNPVMSAESEWETKAPFPPGVVAKCGGIWFDDADHLFKMWYMAGYLGSMCLATSKDGLHWERPEYDVVPGSNLILPPDIHPDSGSVLIDQNAKGDEPRYKMLLRQPDMPDVDNSKALLYGSQDGIHWDRLGQSGSMHDRSTAYYDPLQKKWIQSIRLNHPTAHRTRYYHDGENFIESAQWAPDETVPWLRTDSLDQGKYNPAQLYNFDAIAYESLLIGFHQILHGPDNHVCEQSGMPKLTELYLSTSRDGQHWDRTNRSPLIPAHREYGSWEYGYVESSAGMCCIVGDELWLYYSAYAGDPNRVTKDWRISGVYANSAIGLAKLRRDGFASMRPGAPKGILQTRAFKLNGSHLFVNASTAGSNMTVQVIDSQGNPMPGLSHEDCLGFQGNSCCTQIRWKNQSLKELESQPIRLQFKMDRGDLYAFWLTYSELGKSGGFTAAGGPGLHGEVDQ
ncbi:hypothetical protein SH580_03140 [Coraliomargarita algicola]|uniref:Glycosyl hydrolase family 32 n=1 Tax=Coraliomargarita algicola TaxID=3092156 RepID=A0ABZ0RNM5_9BACT|nr:hypothetical protein [Coraliomargarita sp. J2-16]WPJ96698.1 hypothetical protein SH580_03140 [Coraliomargarita sp. J2-16]